MRAAAVRPIPMPGSEAPDLRCYEEIPAEFPAELPEPGSVGFSEHFWIAPTPSFIDTGMSLPELYREQFVARVECPMRIITVTRIGTYRGKNIGQDILAGMRITSAAIRGIEWVQCRDLVYRPAVGIVPTTVGRHFPHCVNMKLNLAAADPTVGSNNVHVKLFFASNKIHVTGLKIGTNESRVFCEFMWDVFSITVEDMTPVMYKVGFMWPEMIDQTGLCRYIVRPEFKFLAEIFTTIDNIPLIQASYGITDYNGTKIVIGLPEGNTKINAFSTGSIMMSSPSIPLVQKCWEIFKLALELYESAEAVPDPDANAGDEQRHE